MQIKNYLRIYRRFDEIDKKIIQSMKKINQNSFVRLWVSQKDFLKHLKKRLKRGDIANRRDYFQKTIQTLCRPNVIYYLKGRNPNMRDKIFFVKDTWVVIFLDDAKMITSFPLKISLDDLLQDKKNRNYLQIPIPSSEHNPKKVIICQKKGSYAVSSST
ncbi:MULTISPECIES: hypothetical protein [unclassified Nitratiruptor]|uniref:hypothetical protein n=1 Tax=unclassified Nitratiruptor TaxID=2624044 RepID=UPI001916B3DA|nr:MULTISPECIES: hypothetical protein [unclassified Nitratiruptor]BCD59398.1 hypothetical protein NitYY0810_C0134 [Nitratiruptor sp. YY08-10]BCD63322.1 hypothetical protein NitYY0814_C0134 [Nitratiruptor sp. YY08-14]